MPVLRNSQGGRPSSFITFRDGSEVDLNLGKGKHIGLRKLSAYTTLGVTTKLRVVNTEHQQRTHNQFLLVANTQKTRTKDQYEYHILSSFHK